MDLKHVRDLNGNIKMNNKKAIVFGIAGQTGSYLAEHLLDQNYKVYGMIRRNSTPEHQESRISHLDNRIEVVYGDLLDTNSIRNLLKQSQPDEIYNLAAQSHVRISFDIQSLTTQINALGTLNILEAYREICPQAKFLQASSSEMFGNSCDADGVQRLSTPMLPVSPYGVAKLYAYHIVRVYRHSYGLHACNSICFNHESPRRGSNFVTSKVVKEAVKIKLGLSKTNILEIGNLDSYRDWGHASDYSKAQMKIINYEKPDDFIIATGKTQSVRDLINYVFTRLNLNFDTHVRINSKYFRPTELNHLCGDASKAKNLLGWMPQYTFEQTLDEMINHWMKELSK